MYFPRHSTFSPPMTSQCILKTKQTGDTLILHFEGSWTFDALVREQPDFATMFTPSVQKICFNTEKLTKWNSRILVELSHIIALADINAVSINVSGLPTGVQKLFQLTRKKVHIPTEKTDYSSLFSTVGNKSITLFFLSMEMASFTGEIVFSCTRFATGRAQFLKRDFTHFLYDCGPGGLPIVTLIAFLVGFTLAFIGAVQLQMFGADIYVANLVGLTMVREMGPMMAAIIMAGRTGAAFAAQLGTMQVNEEIDALQTMGINPVDFLVLPRMTSLLIMMPLLTIWTDFIGILGGFFIGFLSLDISPILYYEQTISAVHLRHFLVGIIKSVFFGYIVGFSGCLRGMHCGRSANAVGKATTSAVVTAIVLIVISDAAFTFFFNLMGV